MEHILSDKHRHRTGEDEWSTTHQTQLQRAQPRLERRALNRSLVAKVSVPDMSEARSKKIRAARQRETEGGDALLLLPRVDGREQAELEPQKASARSSRVTSWINSRDRRDADADKPLLRGVGGKIDSKGLLSPYVQVLKMPPVHSVPPPPDA